MKQLGQAAVGTGAGTLLYTVPTGMKAIVKDICMANTTSSKLNMSIHLVPSGGTATTDNMLVPNIDVTAYTLVQWTGQQVMSAGGFIQGVGSGAGLTVTISGDEFR